jgi:outer membrane protein OmpA-like peptidoglycan-associated protein
MRRVSGLLLFLLAQLLALAQTALESELKFKVIDIVFTTKDLATKVESLQVKETNTEIRIDLAADVLFDFDKADILPKAGETLTRAADIISKSGKSTVRIEGHTDSKGADALNQKLSIRRAEAVKAWLSKQAGLQKVQFATAGFGATRPAVPNTKPDGSDDPDGRQKNRRVEIIVKK